MIAYVETRLVLDEDISAPFLKYSARIDAYPNAPVVEVFVRRNTFGEAKPPEEIILTITPA